MAKFFIATNEGPQEVEGVPFVTEIGGRKAKLFLYHRDELEGARLSCQRSGMLLGKVAPHLLARFVSTGQQMPKGIKRDKLGAELLLASLIARIGSDKIWQVMDSAPSLSIAKEGASRG